MKLLNQAKDSVISERVRRLYGFKEKLVGILGQENPESVYIKTRFGIHTIGMKFSIDCMVTDDNLVVKKVKENLKPGRLFLWNPKYNNIFELPSGAVKQSGTEVGDKLILKND